MRRRIQGRVERLVSADSHRDSRSILGRMCERPRWSGRRPVAETADDMASLSASIGLQTSIRLSWLSVTGLKSSFLRALIEGRAHKFRMPTRWMSHATHLARRAIQKQALRRR